MKLEFPNFFEEFTMKGLQMTKYRQFKHISYLHLFQIMHSFEFVRELTPHFLFVAGMH